MAYFLNIGGFANNGKKILELYKEKIKKLRGGIGPGVITGGADNDPAGIATYTTAGALFGYSLLWVLLICTPLMIVVQEMAARLALVKRKGLSSIIKEYYGKKTAMYVMSILIVANIATIGADIAGVASVMGLVTGINWMFYIIPVSALIGYLILFKKYRTIRNFLICLTALLVVYIFSSILARPDWHQVLHGFIPSYIPTAGFIAAAIGVIGTTISPYMLFWQASDELEEHKTILRPREIEIDTGIGMVWSNVIAIFIIIAAASTLFVAGVRVETAEQAALALKPLAGKWAYLLFSLGVIISGFLALPVLAGSTAYAISETFGWNEGLDKKVFSAKGFYSVFVLSLLVGSLLSFLPISPIQFLYYTQVLDGFLVPFLIIFLLVLCNNKKVMGKYTNTKLKNLLSIILLVILGVLDIFLIGNLLGII